jgi:AbrB family looped-hinge helix DNA binding protein
MTSRVGDRGQITIETAIREQLAIDAGDEAVQRVEDGRIVIEIVPGRHRRSLAGLLRDRTTRMPVDETWEALRSDAWVAPRPAWPGATESAAADPGEAARRGGAHARRLMNPR